ncbi:DUF917 domain-containing protein [Candidatus Leptofilum sp.]|uniref:DUF917 domain-containing protein n=1 Tax=Candidatus Leptofilum sp. TaxID=3241576 RepID=UPI003B5C6B60
MPYGKLETLQDCEDFVQGCLIMGTGGGGSVAEGMAALQKALETGLTLEWIDAADIPDDVLTASVFSMGSIAPVSQETQDEIASLRLEEQTGYEAMGTAVKELGDYLEKTIGGIIPVELGASNTPIPLVVGAQHGIPVIDGDYAGRAVPDEMQGTPYLHGKVGWPATSVDGFGNVTIAKRMRNPTMFERVGKMLAVAAYGHTTMATNPFSGQEMKKLIVPGTLTNCLRLGQKMRLARERGDDPVETAVSVTNGWRLFEGIVTQKEWEDRDGYMFGTTHLRGTGDYEGQTLSVWFKNENHVTWLNGKPWICSPDLVTLLYKETGLGTTNTLIKEGDTITAVGIKGLESFRTEFGLNESTGPRYFGFDIDYVPIEELMG